MGGRSGEKADGKLVRGKGRNIGGKKRKRERKRKVQKVARIGLINVRGERGKEDEMQEVMKGSEMDIGLVTETHEREGVRVKGITGYERLGKRRGIGGERGEG